MCRRICRSKLSFLLLPLLMMFFACTLRAEDAPRTFLVDGDAMRKARALYRQGDPVLKAAVEELQSQANDALALEPLSVIDDPIVPPSGDRRDYMSVGPYWWPDPKSEDGKPYIRRDGEVNPEYDEYDGPKIRRMTDAVDTLALAYFYTGDERYAKHAATLVRTWFLDDATAMNPHLEFGQAIPGRCTGRGIGIIETLRLRRITDATALLAGSDAWTVADQEGLIQWFDQYLTWLLESRYGIDESRTKNNHATWYDAQVAAFALFVGKEDVARQVLEATAKRRFDTQIEPDGRQPHELARTKSFSYSSMNLSGFFEIATLAEHLDIDLWNHEAEDGSGSIRRALDWLMPYALGDKEWTHQQISGLHGESLIPLLRRAALVYGEPSYETAAQRLAEQHDGMPADTLLRYPRFDEQ